MLRPNSRAAAVLVGATGILLATSSTAYGYWSTTGKGSGSAQSATFQPVTVEVVAPSTAQLFPGGSGDLVVKVSNPNPFAVSVVLAEDALQKITSNKAGCADAGAPSDTSVTGVRFDGATISVPKQATGVELTLAGKVRMTASSVSACQGAVFTIPVTTTSTSA